MIKRGIAEVIQLMIRHNIIKTEPCILTQAHKDNTFLYATSL